MSPRHGFLALLLAATLVAAFWPAEEADHEAGAVVEAVAKPRRATVAEDSPPAPALAAAAGIRADPGRLVRDGGADLFPPQSFRPPPRPQPPPPELPPPPPMAPPVPFTFVGVWTEEGRETVFLDRGNQLLSARPGDTLPGGWRLDAVGAESLTLTYVSLNQQRTLRIAP